jgi:hypothetical protein
LNPEPKPGPNLFKSRNRKDCLDILVKVAAYLIFFVAQNEDGNEENEDAVQTFLRTQVWYIPPCYVARETASVLNQRRFDANPDPNFHFDPDPRILPQIYTSWNIIIFLTFIHSNASLHCFFFLISVKDVIIFIIIDSLLNFLKS